MSESWFGLNGWYVFEGAAATHVTVPVVDESVNIEAAIAADVEHYCASSQAAMSQTPPVRTGKKDRTAAAAAAKRAQTVQATCAANMKKLYSDMRLHALDAEVNARAEERKGWYALAAGGGAATVSFLLGAAFATTGLGIVLAVIGSIAFTVVGIMLCVSYRKEATKIREKFDDELHAAALRLGMKNPADYKHIAAQLHKEMKEMQSVPREVSAPEQSAAWPGEGPTFAEGRRGTTAGRRDNFRG